jgi:AcrR family transcriptional regulator
MATRKKQPRRLGRPPSAESSDTRTRITETARLLFSERGFEVTTNKMLAAKAGITTGALYHYFESKYAIYAAVYDEVQTIVYGHFGVVEAENHTFITRFEAMLEVAYDLNRKDPSLARLIGAVRIDERRDPELHTLLGTIHANRQGGFFERLVELGIKTGEIDPSHRSLVLSLLQIILIGLTDAVSDNPVQHRLAIDGIKALIEGKLFREAPVKR